MIEQNEHAESQRAHAKGLKVHVRLVSIPGYDYRVVTLRSATTARFSTNHFHDTWHLLTDRGGAFVLGRLLWGLSLKRSYGWAVLVEGVHLVPTPFEADPALPFLIAPQGLTRVDKDGLEALVKRLRKPTSGATVRWHTSGLPDARADTEGRRWGGRDWRTWQEQREREQVRRVAGLICYSAPPDVLRARALEVDAMQKCTGTTYTYLAEHSRSHHAQGENRGLRGLSRHALQRQSRATRGPRRRHDTHERCPTPIDLPRG